LALHRAPAVLFDRVARLLVAFDGFAGGAKMGKPLSLRRGGRKCIVTRAVWVRLLASLARVIGVVAGSSRPSSS
jgi:hypothetical protein